MNKIVLSNKHLVLPFSRSTFDSLISFYFKNSIIKFIEIKSIDESYKIACTLELYEFEFILKCIEKNIYIFENNLSENGLTISNFLKYGLDAYMGEGLNNSNRGKITLLFRQVLFNSI